MQLFAEKGDFLNEKRLKRDPKSGLGLWRDPGIPKRDPVETLVFWKKRPKREPFFLKRRPKRDLRLAKKRDPDKKLFFFSCPINFAQLTPK